MTRFVEFSCRFCKVYSKLPVMPKHRPNGQGWQKCEGSGQRGISVLVEMLEDGKIPAREEPVYGNRRQCPYCHFIVPDHHESCVIPAAQEHELDRLIGELGTQST